MSQCDEPDDDNYNSLMQLARAAIDAEDYETALELLLTARESFDPVILDYSIARVQHRLERFAEAEVSYNRFLRRFETCPDPANLTDTARSYRDLAIDQHRRRLQEQEELAAIEAAAAGDEVEDARRTKVGWILIGTGGTLALTGLIIDLAHIGIQDDLQEAYDSEEWDRAREIEDDIDRLRVCEYVFYGSALVVTTVGIVLLVTGSDESPNEVPVVSVAPSRDGAMAIVSASF